MGGAWLVRACLVESYRWLRRFEQEGAAGLDAEIEAVGVIEAGLIRMRRNPFWIDPADPAAGGVTLMTGKSKRTR